MKAEAQAGGVLAALMAGARERARALAPSSSALEQAAAAAPAPRPFAAALRRADGTVAVIAEVKRRSPSAGVIREGVDAVLLATIYAGAGAAAISVLTEPEQFAGSLEDLRRVAAAVPLPVLRKDFIADPLQLLEARAAGAAAVLLIARALLPGDLNALASRARSIGLETLIEVHDPAELDAALAARPSAIGVNARDLATLAIDTARAEAIIEHIPPEVPAIAESGLRQRADVARVAARGADAVLVGTALAGSADPGHELAALCGVPRKGRRT